MTWQGPERGEQVIVPDVVGMEMQTAREHASRAGVSLGPDDPDGPSLRALTWPGYFVVTAQRPRPGTRIHRWGTVVVEFEPLSPEDGAGDREPRNPHPSADLLRAELDEPGEL